ncbi:cupin domain-containing protein [Dyella sp. 2HG41-7]|uniref:cupin domain-containing protein n=1 Tax=Dyella sp. 2HG41-7 TaxID=2883239 RepID=UPI001F2B049D|nr:cupin domain-containing protein [Dyella sp. 2HG41-7]
MRCVTALALFVAIGWAGGIAAAEEHALLSSPLAATHDRQLSAVTVTYAPGQFSAPHRHGGDAFVYVLSGHIRSRIEGGALHVYGPGDSWFEPAGAHHVMSGNASDVESATMLVVFVAPPDATLTVGDRKPDQSSPAARTHSK